MTGSPIPRAKPCSGRSGPCSSSRIGAIVCQRPGPWVRPAPAGSSLAGSFRAAADAPRDGTRRLQRIFPSLFVHTPVIVPARAFSSAEKVIPAPSSPCRLPPSARRSEIMTSGWRSRRSVSKSEVLGLDPRIQLRLTDQRVCGSRVGGRSLLPRLRRRGIAPGQDGWRALICCRGRGSVSLGQNGPTGIPRRASATSRQGPAAAG